MSLLFWGGSVIFFTMSLFQIFKLAFRGISNAKYWEMEAETAWEESDRAVEKGTFVRRYGLKKLNFWPDVRLGILFVFLSLSSCTAGMVA